VAADLHEAARSSTLPGIVAVARWTGVVKSPPFLGTI
jgi:hypothetical protein